MNSDKAPALFNTVDKPMVFRYTITTILYTDGLRIEFVPDMNVVRGSLVPQPGLLTTIVRMTEERVRVAREGPWRLEREVEQPILLNIDDMLTSWSAWIPRKLLGLGPKRGKFITFYCNISASKK